MSPAQVNKYWRLWATVCRGEKIKSTDENRRTFHRNAGCPESMRQFNNAAFDKFIHHAETIITGVDVRDRPREREEHVIAKFEEAIALVKGEGYSRGILVDMHDKSKTLDLPLDPIADQRREDRPARIEETEDGLRPVYRGDLENHKMILKNRFSKMLTHMRSGKLAVPAGCEWWMDFPNRDVIESIISGCRPNPKKSRVKTMRPPVPSICPAQADPQHQPESENEKIDIPF